MIALFNYRFFSEFYYISEIKDGKQLYEKGQDSYVNLKLSSIATYLLNNLKVSFFYIVSFPSV
jgi:hypothetical protein